MREVEKSKRYESPMACHISKFSIVNRPTRLKLNNNVQSSRKKEVEAEEKFESTLSQEQLQALEEENNSLLEGFERSLDQIKYIPSRNITEALPKHY